MKEFAAANGIDIPVTVTKKDEIEAFIANAISHENM
jgi:hypothetical protein